jgi:hypothetical protein
MITMSNRTMFHLGLIRRLFYLGSLGNLPASSQLDALLPILHPNGLHPDYQATVANPVHDIWQFYGEQGNDIHTGSLPTMCRCKYITNVLRPWLASHKAQIATQAPALLGGNLFKQMMLDPLVLNGSSFIQEFDCSIVEPAA